MFDKIKKLFSKSDSTQSQKVSATDSKPETKQTPAKKTRKPRQPKKVVVTSPKIELSEKEQATLADKPYISILKVDVDPTNINSGQFELDWNDKFVLNLIRAGYKIREDDTDNNIVDRWFQTVCRNIALEVYEQQAADLTDRKNVNSDVRSVQARDLGNGRTEVS
jgi:hypothetical protein